MPWFVIGIALWVLLLLVCWVALDYSLVSFWFSKNVRARQYNRRAPDAVSNEPYPKNEERTLANHNEP
jgi:hypothetical protein